MTTWFSSYLTTINPMSVAEMFIMLIGGTFLIGIVVLAIKRGGHFVHTAPALLTTIGILGTFLGIAIGLMNFNTVDIDGSIPLLLEGLKTAFLTSIFGIALSILFKVIQSIVPAKATDSESDITSQMIYQVLKSQDQHLSGMSEEFREVRNSIAGEGDGSVVTQLQKVRSDLGDKISSLHVDLVDEFRAFAEKVSEIGSKQLIEALQDVIRDFNANLTEQFGDNFKQLNEAVHKLVEWQDHYKEQVAEMEAQFKRALEGVSSAEASLGQITSHTSEIPEHLVRQKTILQGFEVEIERLEELLKAYAEMRDQAKEAMPEVRERVKEMVEGMQVSTSETTGKLNEMVVSISEGATKIHQSSKDAANHVREMSETTGVLLDDTISVVEKSMNGAGEKLESVAENAFVTQNARIDQLMNGLNDNINMSVSEHERIINDSVKNLDTQMQAALERAIQSMANNLAGVTNKFTEDYSQLTSQMKRVVETARAA